MVETEKYSVCAIDSLEIKYVRRCLTQNPGSTLLFLNGWGGSSSSWKNNLEVLAKDFDCIALDFPGFGISDDPSETWDVYRYADFLEDFRKTINLETFVLIGKSFGGRVAIAYAAKYGSVLSKLILVAAAGLERKSMKACVLGFLAKNLKVLSRFLNDRAFLQVKTFFYGIFHLKIEQNLYKRRIKNAVINQNLSEEASRISIPTLILWGSEDKVLPPKVGCKLHKKIRNSQLKFFENAGHFINENHPDEFNDTLSDFIDKS